MGGSRSSSSSRAGGSSGPQASSGLTPVRPLPTGVVHSRGNSGTEYYTFDVAGSRIQLAASTTSQGNVSRSYDFDVDGSMTRNPSRSPMEGARIGLKLKQVFEHDVSKQPEGRLFFVSAFQGDGFASYRVRAYQAMGFGPPGGTRGTVVYGIKRNGRLQPLTEREWRDLGGSFV